MKKVRKETSLLKKKSPRGDRRDLAVLAVRDPAAACWSVYATEYCAVMQNNFLDGFSDAVSAVECCCCSL